MARSDHRPALVRANALAAGVTGGVRATQVSLPTPCPAFDVGALIDHLVAARHRAVALGGGESPPADAFPHVDLAAAAAWADDARLVATVSMPWGEAYTGETLVDMYVAELTTHIWDLAVAMGQTLGDDDLAVTALEAARAMLRPDYRTMSGDGSPYGSEIEPPPDATAWERLAAFMGRAPINDRASAPREESGRSAPTPCDRPPSPSARSG
jgi:uncharacterized protein (TIGR03086 family)